MNFFVRAKQTDAHLNPTIYVSVREERSDLAVIRRLWIEDREIFFKVSGPLLPDPLTVYDFAAVASIFTAMRKNRPLHILGPVSQALLRSLEDFQEAWVTWLPDQYHIVPVSADAEVEIARQPANPRGIFAYSGGLDSVFTLLKHTAKDNGRRHISPVAALLVQGFDLPLGNGAALDAASATARAILDDLNIPLVFVETNWKADLCAHWQMEFLNGLVACLNQFNGVADICVVASDAGYHNFDCAWGSNPVSNLLLNGGAMPLRTEGFRYKRTDRLAFIAKHSAAMDKIRVCWEAGETGRNCGICEKCIRTQLNYRAIGLEPKGFDKIAGFWRIATMPMHSVSDNEFILEAQAAATARGIWGLWRVAAYLAVIKNVLVFPYVWAKASLKEAIRSNDRLYSFVRRLRHGKN